MCAVDISIESGMLTLTSQGIHRPSHLGIMTFPFVLLSQALNIDLLYQDFVMLRRLVRITSH